jgi:hypothetical protein
MSGGWTMPNIPSRIAVLCAAPARASTSLAIRHAFRVMYKPKPIATTTIASMAMALIRRAATWSRALPFATQARQTSSVKLAGLSVDKLICVFRLPGACKSRIVRRFASLAANHAMRNRCDSYAAFFASSGSPRPLALRPVTVKHMSCSVYNFAIKNFVLEAAVTNSSHFTRRPLVSRWTGIINTKAAFVFQVGLFGLELILNQIDDWTKECAGHGRVFIGLDDNQVAPLMCVDPDCCVSNAAWQQCSAIWASRAARYSWPFALAARQWHKAWSNRSRSRSR